MTPEGVYRRQLKSNGICPQCANAIPVSGQTLCGYCSEMKQEQNVYYYHRNVGRGFCARHAQVPALPGKKQCKSCQDRDRERKRKRREENKNKSREGVA